MKPVAFDYAAPRDVAEAVALLVQGDGLAKVLAGGQSLGPMLNLRLAQPSMLVDVGRLEALHGVSCSGDTLRLGACVTHASIEDGVVPGRTGDFLGGVAADIAYRAVRNRGTIGGSLCHADPAADWVSALRLLGGVLEIQGAAGTRELPIDNFMISAFSTALADDEVLTAIRLPGLSSAARWSYHKFCRKPGEFAEALACLLLDPDRGVCRAVIGATHGAPHTIADASALLGADRDAAIESQLDAAGIADDAYLAQLQRTVLRRAIVHLGDA